MAVDGHNRHELGIGHMLDFIGAILLFKLKERIVSQSL